MANRPQEILEKAMHTAREAARNADNWTEFLSASARLYKYSFLDTLLIYSYRPDATAVASIEIWNTVMKRWVNRGAKGIPLLDDSGGELKLRYVFDVKDTNGREMPKLWELRREHEDKVIEELTDNFGAVEATGDLVADLLAVVKNVVSDNHQDYLKELLDVREGSLLEELDGLNAGMFFRELLIAGTAWCVLSRAGIEPRDYLSGEDFRYLYSFNTFETIMQLGSATRDISEMMLRQMERTVKDAERGRLAESIRSVQNMGEAGGERGGEHGERIYSGRGIYDTERDVGGGPGGERIAVGQVRPDAENLPEGAQERDVQHDGAQQHSEEALAGLGQDSQGADGAVDGRPPEAVPGPRQGGGPDGLGRPHEQLETHGRGSDPGRAGIQLTFWPTEREQIETIEAEEQNSSAFRLQAGISQSDIDHVLLQGNGVRNGKTRIHEYFMEHGSPQERIAFLKKEYGIGGRSEDFPDGSDGFIQHDGRGIKITKGRNVKPYAEVLLSWRKVQQRISELMDSGQYLPEETRDSEPPAEKEDAGPRNAGNLVGMEEPEQPDSLSGRHIETIDGVDFAFTPVQVQDKEASALTENDEVIKVKDDVLSEDKRVQADALLQGETLHDFRITDDRLGEGGQKTKYNRNIEAIRLLKRIEGEGRLATANEQQILLNYVGWGGLPQAFDRENAQWNDEYAELKALLLEDEYTAARASTLNAHYTSPVVIKAIYQAMENLGFQSGNILEPACGIGNFFGLLPDEMSGSRLYGVELDSITGRIARQLYQSANIAVQGFETADMPDSFFDIAVGNVPFGSYKLADKRYDKNNFFIHDYFFAKTLDKVRPGGIIAFVTSKGTLDKQSTEVRKYIAQRAELLGAIRLPNTAFKANAGTEVTTDIIFLQKRDRIIDITPDWVHLGLTENGIPVNSYFADNPHMILGTMAFDDSMYGKESDTACHPIEGADLASQLQEAVSHITGNIPEIELEDKQWVQGEVLPASPDVRNFSFAVIDGSVYYRNDSVMVRQELTKTAEGRVKGLIGLRDHVRALMDMQLHDYPDEDISAAQQKLHALYDSFTAQYGLINNRANASAFDMDDGYFLLCSLEILDEDRNLERKAEIFHKRTIRKHMPATKVDTPSEALAVSLSEKACVDIPFMSQLSGISPEQIIGELKDVIFRDIDRYWDSEKADPYWSKYPANKAAFIQQEKPVLLAALESEPYAHWVMADEYLSGNVRSKLKTAERFHEVTGLYPENVEMLRAVQPKDLEAGEIDVRLGATWIPPEVIKKFMFELLDTPRYVQYGIKVHYSPHTAEWNIEGKNNDR